MASLHCRDVEDRKKLQLLGICSACKAAANIRNEGEETLYCNNKEKE